jgi:hypothetical protein
MKHTALLLLLGLALLPHAVLADQAPVSAEHVNDFETQGVKSLASG